jgi:hypothetical protein
MEYKYIKDVERLIRIAEVLNVHEIETKAYYLSHLAPRLLKIEGTKEKLAVLFAIANSQRQGLGKKKVGVKTATAGFHQGIEQNIKECMSIISSEEAHLKFLKWLCGIPGMDQKTANLFLKWVVMLQTDFQLSLINWQSWRFNLHVPLDRWVIRLMSNKYLNLCSESYEQDFLKDDEKTNGVNLALKKEGYILLQKELGEAILQSDKPRIVLDNLWFVGAFFCNFHPIVCDSCWINKECSNYEHIPDWGNIVTKTKDELKNERKKHSRALKMAEEELKKTYPEEYNRLLEEAKKNQ